LSEIQVGSWNEIVRKFFHTKLKSKMKTYLIYILFAALAVLQGCKDDDQEVTPTVTSLSLTQFPEDQSYFLLNPAGTDSVKIFWEHSKASDATLVMYSVQFDEEGGDFSQPVGTVVTDSVGLSKRARIHHKTLNIIAENAGIEPLAKGKLKWRIVASTGIVSAYSEEHIIEVERPIGIAEIPNNLYLTGDATEAGTNVTKGIIFKKLSPGVFEIFTSLGAGTYKFVNNIITSPVVSFYPAGGVIKKSGIAGSPADTKRLYHIYLDFNTAESRISEILSVGLWHGADNDVLHALVYQNNGMWTISGITPYTTGLDNRYKFKMTKKAADGTLSDIFWGSSAAINNPPVTGTAATYFYLFPREDFSQYDYSYKFSVASENKVIDLSFILTSSVPYTHKLIIR
jgi:starch-binding outer membrane protein SusE/F